MTLQYTRLYEHIKLSIDSVILHLPEVYILTANLMQTNKLCYTFKSIDHHDHI